MSHSPGAWDYTIASGAEVPHIAIEREDADGELRRIADVYSHDMEGEANALLIAAAPDLLAALRGLTEAYRIPDFAAPHVYEEMAKRYNAAKAAIAKATGEGSER